MLDEANAMAELNQSQEDSDIDNLAAKYDSAPQDAAVDDELAALKRQRWAYNINNSRMEKSHGVIWKTACKCCRMGRIQR